MLSFEQFIHGDSQKNVDKIPELKLEIGGRPEGTKVAVFRKLENFTKIFHHFKRFLPIFD
jgi:hypothetical protein